MKAIKIILLLFFLSGNVFSQKTPNFWNEITAFKKSDSAHFPPKHAILFVGSSSFRFWTSVQKDFNDDSIINRGFGGSTLADVIRYFYDIIYPYAPKKIFIYCGENDLAAPWLVSPQVVLQRFKTLYCMIRTNFSKAEVVFVSIKPSPSRKSVIPNIIKANQMVKAFLKDKPNTHFVDVFSKMVNPDGSLRNDIYRPDELHMNPEGYKIWIKALKPLIRN